MAYVGTTRAAVRREARSGRALRKLFALPLTHLFKRCVDNKIDLKPIVCLCRCNNTCRLKRLQRTL